MAISMIASLLKRVVAICLAFVIFWHITHHDRPAAARTGRAIVNVPASNVRVILDLREFAVGSPAESPLVCELEPGVHRARVLRGAVLLAEESFEVQPGREVEITPYRGDDGAGGAAGAPELAASIRPPSRTAAE
jgi:hypothetical protein